MFQAYSVIFTTFDILKPIFPHLGIFRMIQAQLDLFMYIKAYSEPMANEHKLCFSFLIG